MALDQTTMLSTTIIRSSSNLKASNSNFEVTKIKAFSSLSKPNRTSFPIKCSLHFQHHQQQEAVVTYPKPTEIQWKKELCNSVNLIGVIGVPVEFKNLSSGKAVAWTRLAVRKSASETSWISLTFWDELAHTASQHVQKGQQIYVSGRLISDTVENEDGKSQTFYKVVVQQLNFIERSASSASPDDRDFDSAAGGKKFANSSTNSTGSIEGLWQAFFANPLEWWDNRKNKRSPKYPDFKHKDTGEALWVEGRNNPPWVRSQLAILDARMGSFYDQESRVHSNIMTVDDLHF